MALEQEYLLKQEEAEETYQKKLTAGSGININPTTNVISATGSGGSSVTYTSEYPQGETIGILEINSVQNPIKMPELIPGDNISITPDPTTGALTIDSTGGGNVDDVKIGNTSIVDANKIANIPTMTGATSQAAGSAGVVPAPLVTDVDKFLKADGTWDNCSSATELTKAQYDALPSSKESDGVLYMIKDINTTSGTTSDLTRAAYNLLPASKESDDIFYYITDEGVIMHNGVQYAGGGGDGSSVIANPSGTPTDTLQTVEIDGTIYEIEGGASGGSYTETSLWSGNDTATMTLTDSFENYDAIKVIGTAVSGGVNYRLTNTWLTSTLSSHINDGVRFGLTGDLWYVYFDIADNTTLNRRDQYVTYISEIIGIKFGGGSSNSEIIPISAGTNTTSRTFTFNKKPKFIKFYYEDPLLESGWCTDATLIWGQTHMNYISNYLTTSYQRDYGGVTSITYSQDEKSFTITGGNAFGAMNTTNGTGYMYVEYESSSSSGSENIEDMTWTLLTSTTGTGTSTAIPSGTKRLIVLIECAGKVQIVGNESLAAINKVLDITSESNYILGGHWIDQTSNNYGDNTCIISNGSVTAYSSYNTITTYVYALS